MATQTQTKTPKVTKLPTRVAKNGDSKQRSKPQPQKAKAQGKAKANGQATKPATAKKASAKKPRTSGLPSRAKGDFTNDQKITVKGKISNGRAKCFKTGMTVGQCLEAQKKAGFRGRRGYIRFVWQKGDIQIK